MISSRTIFVVFFYGIALLAALTYANFSLAAATGVLAVGFLLVLIFYKIRVLFISIFILKPLIDLAWDAHFFSLGGSTINLLRIVGIFVPLICIVHLIFTPSTIRIKKINFWVIAFLAINALSTITTILNSNDFLSSFISDTTYWFRLANGMLMYIALPYVFDLQTEYLSLIRIFFYSTIIPTIVSASLIVTDSFNITVGQQVVRFAGLYHDAGGLSINAFIGITLSLLYWYLLPKFQYAPSTYFLNRLITVFVFTINLLMLYWSVTRMMYLVTFVFIIGWLFFQYRVRWSLLLLIPLTITYIWSDASFRQRNWKEIKAYEEYQNAGDYQKYVRVSGGGRLDRWDTILDRISNMDMYEWLMGTGKGSAAHNEYLDTFMRTGFLGLFSLIMSTGVLFFFLLRKARNTPSNSEIKPIIIFSSFLLISLWLMSLTGYTITQTTLGIFVWSTLSIAVYSQSEKRILA